MIDPVPLEEPFLPFEHPRGQAPVATHLRSTLVVSSLQALRAHDVYPRYLAEMEPRHREAVESLVAGTWAIDRLALDARTIEARLRQLTWRGGDVGVWRLGPKEARYEWVGLPLASSPYFVTAFGGYFRALHELFATTAYARLETKRSTATSFSYRTSRV